MKRPPVLRPRLASFKVDSAQNRSLDKIMQSSRNSSVEQKDRHSSILWNVLGNKPRAQSINKENVYIETKSSRESLSYVKETLKKTLITIDAYPRTLVSVPPVRNTFYASYDHLQAELDKFEKIKRDASSMNTQTRGNS